MILDQLGNQAPEWMTELWAPEQLVQQERELWCAVLEAQTTLGFCPGGEHRARFELGRYRAVLPQVDLASIRQREYVTRHDVKARLEEYNALARCESIHRGMTSADVVDNTSQYRIRQSARQLIRRRPSMFYQLEPFLLRYPLRGIKGPVGTQQDMVDLLGSVELANHLDQMVAQRLGFARVMTSTPQVYHRSLDLEVVSLLLSSVAGYATPSMPARAVQVIMQGLVTMTADYAGDTWNEGDVSTSVVRRVALPQAFFLAASVCDDGY